MSFGQTKIRGAYLRGGSSKAVFLRERDIPPPGPLRDAVLKRVMGTPDPMQIDGMGGTRIVTSKIAIVETSQRTDADVDYTFAQAGIAQDQIDYTGNCGNISSGVAPFAIDEGLITTPFRKGQSLDPSLVTREVRIWQVGTGKLLIAHVPVDEKSGMSVSGGNFAIAGVPGTGAPILMDFRNTIGAALNKGILPTGNPIDVVDVGGKEVEVTICDVANICIFVRAEDMGATGNEAAATISANESLIARCRELRGKAAKLVGMCQDWQQVDQQSPGLPMVVLVSPAPSDTAGSPHLAARLLLNNSCHDSMAGTGGTCMAACSRVAGSVVEKVLASNALNDSALNIAHPLGIMPIKVEAVVKGSSSLTVDPKDAEFRVLAFVRTSRRIMEGALFVPADVWEGTVRGESGH